MRFAWYVVATVVVLRAIFAATLPMTGDEAYYWEWGRHLAAGYIDHPPLVALYVAAFSWLGGAFGARLAFLLCGAGVIAAVARAAFDVWRTRESAASAALAASLAPMLTVTAVTVSPEGPAACAWAVAILAALRAFETGKSAWYAALGVAMGAALLSHFLCWALVFGIFAAATFVRANRHVWRDGLWIAFAIAAVIYAPFLSWNAQHGWASFAFAVLNRHPADETQLLRPLITYALGLAAFSPGLWIAATLATRHPRHAVIAWTALPLAIALLLIAFHERVEAYWFEGPFISLCVALPGVLQSRTARSWTFVPAIVMSALIFAAGIAPFQIYGVAQRAGLHLRNAGPFEIFTYGPLAAQAKILAESRNAIVMTDGYGFSSLLDFYAGIPPVFIGYDSQGREARRWYSDAQHPETALFLDKAPLSTRPDFQTQLARACGRVTQGPVIRTEFRLYYTTWCESMRPSAISILRFEEPSGAHANAFFKHEDPSG